MSEIVVSKGGKATFVCELPDSSYSGHWYQNNKQLSDGSKYEISVSGGEQTLVISSTLKSDEGSIVFKAKKGNVEVPFQLTVTEPPSIDPEEFKQSAQSLQNLKTGTPMVLRVPFSGASPIKASWKFNGKNISSSGRYKIVTTSSESTLTVDNLQGEDCGTYEVTLENKFGNMRVPVEVTLSDVSQVNFETVQVPGKTVQKSSTMTVDSESVEAPPKPAGNIKFDNMAANHFKLSFVTTAQANGNLHYIVEQSSGNGWTQCATFQPGEKSIPITGLEAGKRYTFRIKAANPAGESEGLESRSVTVQKPSNPPVLDAVVVEKLSGDQHLKAGKELRLKIPYTGFPLPIAQWTKDGKKMTTKGRVASETSDVDTTFSISGLTAEDSGEYGLLLKNKEGNAKLNFNVVIIDAPSAPAGPIVMDEVMSTEMTFSWNPPKSDGGKPVQGYVIERKDTKSPTWTQVGKVDPNTLSFTSDGLTKGLKYSYRIKAYNSEGESKPLLSPLVLASGPPGAPGTPTPTTVRSTSIGIKWDEPSNDGGSSVTGYSVEMREVGGDWSSVTSSHVKGTTAQLDNLVPENEYEFRVSAKNSTGKGRWAETKKPITAMDAPEPPVISEAAKQSFSEPVSCHAGEDVNLKVPVSGIPRPTATWSLKGKPIKDPRIEGKVNKGGAELKIADAKRGDSGVYHVKVENSEGEVEADITVKITDVPSAPEGSMKTVKASSKALTVGWAPPSDDGGMHITQYLVERKTCGDELEEWSRIGKVFPGEDLKMTSDHVDKGTSYKFRVSAQNALGSSPFLESAEILADDKFKPPAAVAAPVVSDITKSSCVVTWDEPDDNGSPISGYIVELKRIGRRNWVPQNGGRLVMDKTLKVKDLTKDCEFAFRVTAENEGGTGPAGKESEVFTAKDPIPPPPPPTDFQMVDKTDKSITFTWQPPPNLSSSNFNGYFIERCYEGKDNWVKCNETPIRGSKYKVVGLNTGDKFKFRIRPYNDGGYGNAFTTDSYMEIKQLQEKPKISFDSSIKQSIDAQASGTLRLMASVSGKPTPIIHWQKDGVDLDKRGVIHTQGGVTQLTIRNLAKSDSGTYSLVADNQSGTIKKMVNLVVKDSPDPPCNIKLGELQDDGSLLITWDPPLNDGGNPIKHYCLQRRDAYSRSFQTIKDKISGTSYQVRDLKPGCTYYFRIIAENELGRGDGNQSNLLTVIQKRGPLHIEKIRYNKMNLNKGANFNLAMKPVSIQERGAAKFTCATVGKPEPEIAWYKDGIRIKANNKYSMRNQYGVCTLTIYDCRARDAGMYKCEANNQVGRAICEANLSVLPRII
ncbi:immunoglobulin-like and fibronectin type III domain-containing protein 1 isoform X2 [Ciona intestinalis]